MLENHIHLVKGQIAYYEDLIDRFPPNHPRYDARKVEMYERLLMQHDELLKYLKEQKSLLDRPRKEEIPANPSVNAGAAVADEQEKPGIPDELAGLPEELLAQLSDRAKKGQNDPLVQIIQDRGGMATLDEILIDLYRRYNEIGTRNIIANKLYRLSKQGLVRSVEGKKGVYSTA